MPQELNVLRCYSCKMYQVQIVKESKKWQCKICNEKQSLMIVYFRGSGVHCRNYVQVANLERQNSRAEETFRTASIEAWGLDCDADSDDPCDCSQGKSRVSKWSKYLTNNEETDTNEKENFSSQNPAKRRKFELQGKKTRSLPTSKNYSTGENSRSQSFPRICEKFNLSGEKCEFLEGGDDKENFGEQSQGKVRKFSSRSKWDDFLNSQSGEEAPKDMEEEEEYVSFWVNDANSLERRRKNAEEGGEKNVAASAEIKWSQVDTSSDSSCSAFRGIETNLFDDLNVDLDVTIDF